MMKILLLLCIFCLTGCYSFRGVSIASDINTYYINDFSNRTPSSPPTLTQDFIESLDNKVKTQTKLKEDDESPHLEFSGEIANFDVSYVAPRADETIASNRLTIVVKVDFVNNKDEEKNWSSQFSFFSDFEANENLLDKQEELIEIIFDQIIEDIFNRAFTNW